LKVELGEEPVLVEADPARLQQIVVNLLDNAAKYNRRGGHAALTLERKGGRVVVCVTDDGIGIEGTLQKSIFEPFVQGTAALRRPLGGMGVGLSVVRSLVDMHGGSVEAHSEGPDRGSQFTVCLPLATAGEPSRFRRRPIEWPRAGRVVIIEDNPDGREMLQLLLEQAGHEVFAAADGKSGIEVIDRVEPDVAIVDIGLPIMDGLEVARQVRSQPKHKGLLMVALTGYGQASDQAAALQAGFDQHLVKPLDPDEFVRWARPDRDSSTPD
jgi:two-component system CheB/CheR fusion protein